tara:strand:- start:467 stop:727 length:261 start_codon:yes stop_codon:yes gene_type:complete
MNVKTLKATPAFKVGDFVRIKEGTHQEDIPASRMGHIQGYANGSRHYHSKGVTVQPTDQYNVYMTNGKTLKFHEMFLELVDEAKVS